MLLTTCLRSQVIPECTLPAVDDSLTIPPRATSAPITAMPSI